MSDRSPWKMESARYSSRRGDRNRTLGVSVDNAVTLDSGANRSDPAPRAGDDPLNRAGTSHRRLSGIPRLQRVGVQLTEVVAEFLRDPKRRPMAEHLGRFQLLVGVEVPLVDGLARVLEPAVGPGQIEEVQHLLQGRTVAGEKILGLQADERNAREALRELEAVEVDLGPEEQALLVRTELLPAARVLRVKDVAVAGPKRPPASDRGAPPASGVRLMREVRDGARDGMARHVHDPQLVRKPLREQWQRGEHRPSGLDVWTRACFEAGDVVPNLGLGEHRHGVVVAAEVAPRFVQRADR